MRRSTSFLSYGVCIACCLSKWTLPVRFLHLIIALLVAVTMNGCRSHLLEDGPFALTTDEVLRDDCNAEGTLPWLERGSLKTTGDLVRFAFSVDKFELHGSYKEAAMLSGDAEQLVMNGSSSNGMLLLNERQCLLDTLHLYVEATTVDADSFTGATTVTFQSRNVSMCNCSYWYLFTARRVP